MKVNDVIAEIFQMSIKIIEKMRNLQKNDYK